MLYFYILGCGIACLVFAGISCMDTVVVKPAEVLVKVLLWPVALIQSLTRSSDARHMKLHTAR